MTTQTQLVAPKNFVDACKLIKDARIAEDLFLGLVIDTVDHANESRTRLDDQHRILVRLVHPDLNPGREKDAHAAFTKLEQLREEAIEKLDRACGINPKPKDNFPIVIPTRKHTYVLTGLRASGSTCGVFEGCAEDKQKRRKSILLRVPHSHKDNDLMQREAKALKAMQEKLKLLQQGSDADIKAAKFFGYRIPCLLESINIEEPGSTDRKTANAFLIEDLFFDGWYTLEEIRKAYPKGVSTRIMTFIWNRVLEGLTFAHSVGVLHNALTPNHVVIHAESHMGNIIDWTASTFIKDKDKIPYVEEKKYGPFFPQEILDPNSSSSPESDIYMSAWLMVYLLGGNPEDRTIPQQVEEPIRQLLNQCLQPRKIKRPRSAGDVMENFRQITRTLFGARKFVELKMEKTPKV